MNSLLFLAVFDGSGYIRGGEITFGMACIIALVAILIVFAILAIIICAVKIMQLCFKGSKGKKEATEEPKEEAISEKNTNIEDDDMMAAVLVATIDYANETKKDVRLKSVKRIG